MGLRLYLIEVQDASPSSYSQRTGPGGFLTLSVMGVWEIQAYRPGKTGFSGLEMERRMGASRWRTRLTTQKIFLRWRKEHADGSL